MSQEVEKKEQEQVEQPNAVLITAGLANALVNYLSSKPHGEVENLVKALRESRPITVKQEAAEPVNEKAN